MSSRSADADCSDEIQSVRVTNIWPSGVETSSWEIVCTWVYWDKCSKHSLHRFCLRYDLKEDTEGMQLCRKMTLEHRENVVLVTSGTLHVVQLFVLCAVLYYKVHQNLRQLVCSTESQVFSSLRNSSSLTSTCLITSLPWLEFPLLVKLFSVTFWPASSSLYAALCIHFTASYQQYLLYMANTAWISTWATVWPLSLYTTG